MPNLEWQQMRDDANTVPCRHCKAHPGDDCRNPHTGAEIALPAHTIRSKAAAARRDTQPKSTHSE